MLPNGWEMREVGELFDVKLGKMLNQLAKEKTPRFPYLANQNVQWGRFVLDNLSEMHFSSNDCQKYSLRKGDVIMCEGGEVGRCAIWNEELKNCYYQKALHRLRTKGEVSPSYFQAYMQFISGTKILEDFTTKTSIAHLTKEKLIKLPVNLPPEKEQKRISEILSTWDKAIEITEKLIQNSQQRKMALMQQLLTGKKRLPGFAGEWKDCSLSDVVEITMGSSPKSENYNDSRYGLPLIQGNADIEDRKSSPRVFTSQITKKCYEGDILLSVRAPVGMVSISCHEACIGRGMASLRAKNKINQDFMYQYLLWIEHRWARFSQGSTFDSVNSSDIKQIRLKIPSYDEQNEIAKFLSNIDKGIKLLIKDKKYLEAEKKALMQQLLTGKKRVKV